MHPVALGQKTCVFNMIVHMHLANIRSVPQLGVVSFCHRKWTEMDRNEARRVGQSTGMLNLSHNKIYGGQNLHYFSNVWSKQQSSGCSLNTVK